MLFSRVRPIRQWLPNPAALPTIQFCVISALALAGALLILACGSSGDGGGSSDDPDSDTDLTRCQAICEVLESCSVGDGGPEDCESEECLVKNDIADCEEDCEAVARFADGEESSEDCVEVAEEELQCFEGLRCDEIDLRGLTTILAIDACRGETAEVMDECISNPDPPPARVPSLTTSFLTSSTGTSTIEAGGTIQFEVILTLSSDRTYNAVFWSLTSDVNGATGPYLGNAHWDGLANNLTDWSWNYEPGTSSVNFSTNGVITPAGLSGANSGLPSPGQVANGWFAQNRRGTGTPSIVGTVTIEANTIGEFEAGAFLIPGLDGFFDCCSTAQDHVTVIPAPYTVVSGEEEISEPFAALIFGIGLPIIAVALRRP